MRLPRRRRLPNRALRAHRPSGIGSWAFLPAKTLPANWYGWVLIPLQPKHGSRLLTDTEVARIDQHLDQLPAGGSSVIGALVFIFVLLLITDILGFTKVFPFTRSMR